MDKIICFRKSESLIYLIIARVIPAPLNIVADGAIEVDCFLRRLTDMTSERFPVPITHISTEDRDSA